jgi:aminoglycoside phosphotransferase (APT) family kinase protein
MDEPEVRSALVRVGMDPQRIVPIDGGWANWTFELDGEHIVRFPRSDAIALTTHRELALLPELADQVTFEVPVPASAATYRGRPFFAYRRLPGRPLSDSDRGSMVVTGIGTMLRELHGFPVDRAATLLRLGRPETAWSDHYTDLWSTIATVALPEIGPELADEVRREYTNFVEAPPEFPPCLIHNDLGPEHVLLDEVTGEPRGLIDFEDATVGDPATDLAGLVTTIGYEAVPALLAGRDVGERVADRIWFYRWVGSLHAIIYGVVAGVDEARIAGIDELPRRLRR